jgi:uncharacterized membrane protein
MLFRGEQAGIGGQMSVHVVGGPPKNMALLKHAEKRAQNVQNRIADRITGYAGSMNFVYLHIALFTIWMLVLERKPWPTLTLIVSLEAIFLSTFVMISQNRADARRQVLADHQWEFVQTEEGQNEELLRLSKQILELTQAIHQLAVRLPAADPAAHAAGSGGQDQPTGEPSTEAE